MRPRLTAVAVALLLLTSACATATGARTKPLRMGGSANTITWYDLQALPDVVTVHTAIHQLRPLFFSTRPGGPEIPGRDNRIAVYIDGLYAGDETILQSIRARDVANIEYLRPTEAFARFGSSRGTGGVLLVTLNKQ